MFRCQEIENVEMSQLTISSLVPLVILVDQEHMKEKISSVPAFLADWRVRARPCHLAGL
jgi:hypothetical protein